MKYLNFILLAMCLPCLSIAQNTYKTVVDPGGQSTSIVLTNYNPGKLHYKYKNCLFTIKTEHWVRDSLKYVLPVTTTITNGSNDTIFFDWSSHGWRKKYRLDTTYLKIDEPNTDAVSDIPYYETVLPHKSMSFEIELIPKKDTALFHGKLKLGLCLTFKRNRKFEQTGVIDGLTSKRIINKFERDVNRRTHTLWSNTVEI